MTITLILFFFFCFESRPWRGTACSWISGSAQPDLCVYELRFTPFSSLSFVVGHLESSSSLRQGSFLLSPPGEPVACCLTIFNLVVALAIGDYLLLFYYLPCMTCYYVHFAISPTVKSCFKLFFFSLTAASIRVQ